jgi:hypothetical protein
MRSFRSTLWLPLLLLLARPAQARPYELAVTGGAVVAPSDSMDAVSSSHVMSSFSLGAATPLSHELLWLTARVTFEGTSADDFGAFRARYGDTSLDLGLRASWRLAPRVRLFAGAEAGVIRESFRLEPDAQGQTLSDSAWAVCFGGAAGVDVPLVSWGKEGRMGLRAELGYRYVPGMGVALSPDAPSDGRLHLPTQPSGVGTIDSSGAMVRVGAIVQF